MQTPIHYSCLCGISLALVGCAAEQRRFTGFLQDYAMLEPDPMIEDGLVYWNPDIDLTKYSAVLIEPVDVHFMRPQDKRRAGSERIARFRRWFADELRTAIGRHLEIATQPGPNVIRARFQVSNLILTRPVGQPEPPEYRQEYVVGSANVEIEGLDSVSGERALAFVGPGIRTELSETYKAIDPWDAANVAVKSRMVAWIDQTYPRFRPGN